MGDPRRPAELNLATFWSMFGKLVGRLGRERAHAEIVLIMHEGQVRQVRVNRSYLPQDLPEVD